MAVRALIIAVENYPSAAGMATTLPGTLQAGLSFRQWLIDKLTAEGRAEGAQVLFCSEPQQPGQRGATRTDVLTALLQLKQDGRNATDELFVFFSGHGFAFLQGGSRADVVITSEFQSAALSGACCLKLDEVVRWLLVHMGPGRHYYFVDACRNNLSIQQVAVPNEILPFDANTTPDASSFVLQSTVPGAVASVGSAFPASLLAGLKGKGKAKVWPDEGVLDAMVVRYDSLRRFLKQSLDATQPITSAVAGEFGESEVVFAQIKPVPTVACTIKVAGCQPGDAGTVVVRRGRAAAADPPRQFVGGVTTIPLEPDAYTLSVTLDGAGVTPLQQSVDLFDDLTVHFRKVAPPALEVAPPMMLRELNVQVEAPPDASFVLRNMRTGIEKRGVGGAHLSLDEGSYQADIFDADRRLLLAKTIDIREGSSTLLRPSVPHLSITKLLPGTPEGPDFSESLGGPMKDRDLNLWLALLGGGLILGPRGDYSKIARFPLHHFGDERAGASPVYILAGLAVAGAKLRVSVSDDRIAHWQDAAEPLDLPGIQESYTPCLPGPKLVTLEIADGPSYTVASVTSPNRATLVTLTVDDDGSYCVSQYVLPLGHLLDQFPVEVRERLVARNQLQDVRLLSQATKAFSKRRNILKEGFTERELSDLLFSKWLDPIGASMAVYELLRRGRRDLIDEAVTNLKLFFFDFPDTAAITKLVRGEAVAVPRVGVPLFSDGLRAFPDYAQWLPLPASHLDYRSPWTAWRSAHL